MELGVVIRHAWSVLAAEHTIDAENVIDLKALESLKGTLPGRAAPGTRFLLPHRMEVVSLWYRIGASAERAVARIRCLDPKGSELGRIQFDVEVPVEHQHMRTITQLDTVPYTGAGTYEYVVEIADGPDYRELTRVPLEIDVAIGTA